MPNATCTVDGCDSDAKTRGWCMYHYQQQYRGRPLVERIKNINCQHCGDAFPQRHGRIYCGQRCRELAQYALLRDNPERWANYLDQLRSEYVKKTEQPGYVRPPSKPIAPCSAEACDRPSASRTLCKMHYRRWQRANGLCNSPSDAWSDKRKEQGFKRKALKRGATEAVSFSREAVFERDGWLCGICSAPVDKALAYPHPMSASLDHVQPLVHGGTHGPENAQCSHLRCNLSKGARVTSATA